MSIEVGMKGRAETVVSQANTAQAACSGALPVFGTPFMCALMEEASWKSIAPHLEPGQSTVGNQAVCEPRLRLPCRHQGVGRE
ncbi:MAG: thioesterase family protein [Lawsonibacter sp.]